MKRIFHVLAITVLAFAGLAVTLCMAGCHHERRHSNAAYYWRTVLSLNDKERKFLSENEISTLYLRLFDVDADSTGRHHPVQTLRFVDTVPPGITIVPVVFITPGSIDGRTDYVDLADKIVSRMSDMLTQNGYPEPREVQIDYDWTRSNQDAYFKFLQEVGKIMADRHGTVSTTVRLHQLSMTPPPVDYGVLMLYNTGNYADYDTDNSILTLKDVKPYMPHLKGYKLPLRPAYPLYAWDLVFGGKEFQCIARGIDVHDTRLFSHETGPWYRCVRYTALPAGGLGGQAAGRLYPGDMIRHEEVRPEVIDSLKTIISTQRRDLRDNVIIYHLDSNCIDRYETDFYKNLFGIGGLDRHVGKH